MITKAAVTLALLTAVGLSCVGCGQSGGYIAPAPYEDGYYYDEGPYYYNNGPYYYDNDRREHREHERHEEHEEHMEHSHHR